MSVDTINQPFRHERVAILLRIALDRSMAVVVFYFTRACRLRKL
jgi:hypothetical protein